VAHDIWIPVGHVVSLFARESGEGMGFEVEPYEPSDKKQPEQETENKQETDAPAKSGKVLKFVK